MDFFVGLAQLFGDPLAIADIADRTQHHQPLRRGERAKTDFHRDFRAIAPSRIEIEIGTHAARLWAFGKTLTMALVMSAVALRDQHLYFLPDHLIAFVAKQLLRLRVGLNNGSVTVDGDGGIGKRFEQVRGKKNFTHAGGGERGLRWICRVLRHTIPLSLRLLPNLSRNLPDVKP